MNPEEDVYAPLYERAAKRNAGLGCGPGWKELVFELVDRLDRIWEGYNGHKGRDCWEILQLKEKFGELRLYTGIKVECDSGEEQVVQDDWRRRNQETGEAVACFAQKSMETCEFCGKPGKRESLEGWIKTICPDCLKSRSK